MINRPATALSRRSLLAAGSAALLLPRAARAATTTDGAGRSVTAPAQVLRVFPAGPPAAILLYTLAPELLLGWPRANSAAEREFLLGDVGARPEVGRVTGRGNTANVEAVLALKPDLILDVGYVNPTYISLADRVQEQIGVPYALLDGHFEAAAATYRTLGALLGRRDAAEALAQDADAILKDVTGAIAPIPKERRARVYYARGPRGLETGLGGSINMEAIDLVAQNVAGATPGGLAEVSLEQVLAWDPEVILTIDPAFADGVTKDPAWAPIKAVRERRVHLAPRLPFGWIDLPPSVNRLIGLKWLAKVLYPDRFGEDMHALTRDFFARYYHVMPTDAQIERVLAGRS
jgi:iron complex transport system substrate-binding protein